MFYYLGKVFTVLVENNFYPVQTNFTVFSCRSFIKFLGVPVFKVISLEMCSLLQEWFSADLKAKSTVS